MENLDLAERVLALKRDPWFFLRTCVYTIDQTDQLNPIKKFPSEDPDMADYLRLYTRVWEKNNRIAVPKSRRMFMTWINISLHLWLAMFHVGRFVGVVSKKEDDSAELLKRMKFIYDNIPDSVIPRKMLPKIEDVYGEIRFPEINSTIKAFAQGDDQMRQFTISAILADEMAFWERAKQVYSSAVPTLEGGGRFTAISSPAPGFFRELVEDQLDGEERQIDVRSTHNPIPGVSVWKNPRNGFFIYQLHYSANLKKRDPKYIEEVRRSMPRSTFMQEYELQWESFLGKPVYPDFDAQRHVAKTTIYPEIGLPLLRGWDWGLTPACIVAQLVEGQLRVLAEFTAENMGAKKFVPLAMAQCATAFPHWHDKKKNWRDYIDPAGNNRDQSNDEASCALEVIKNGAIPIPGVIAFEARKSAVTSLLIRQTQGGPGIILDPSVRKLIDGFKGGYHYPEKANDVEPRKLRPLKNEYSHPHDGLQYIASRIADIEKPKSKGIAAPQYNWSRSPAIRQG